MKPILFNTEMVRAILEGRKTVTRRPVNPQPKAALFPMPDSMCWPGCFANCEEPAIYRPPYKIGDILWVRETWAEMPYGFVYRADNEDPEGWEPDDRWHPSIHMPREAARIFLRVTDVRVERLQDISLDPPGPENQVIKEGCLYLCDFVAVWERTLKPTDRPDYGWEADPWVWVVSFERISKEEAQA